MSKDNIVDFVLDTSQFVKTIEKQTKRLYADNKKVILIKQKIKEIDSLNNKIAENYNLIKTVKCYWDLKKSHYSMNKRIKIKSKEWIQKKIKLTKKYLTNNEKKFEKIYPNKMLEIIKFKKIIDFQSFDKELRKEFNIKFIEECTLEELCNSSNLRKCIKDVHLDNDLLDSIPMDLNDIFKTFDNKEKKLLNDLFN